MHRPLIFFGFALLACLLVFVPSAGAVLDPTDTATGTGALASENGGSHNTADGYFALSSNTTGGANTAVGSNAMKANTIGDHDTAVGHFGLTSNVDGEFNTAVGDGTLSANTTGDSNSAFGTAALDSNLDGNNNVAVGTEALPSNSTGDGNTAIGFDALYSTTGDGDTGLGEFAGQTGTPNTTGSFNTFLGWQAGPGTSTPLENATAIGARAQVSESNALVLGIRSQSVGVGTESPQSGVQLGRGAREGYGQSAYLQLPVVTKPVSPPPADECNATTFVGRLVLQYADKKVRTTLWVCPPTGLWTKLAQG